LSLTYENDRELWQVLGVNLEVGKVVDDSHVELILSGLVGLGQSVVGCFYKGKEANSWPFSFLDQTHTAITFSMRRGNSI
jgi:hypothetical protein